MEPNRLATVGLVGGWVVALVALLRARRPANRSRVQSRNRRGLAGILVQAAAFFIVFGVRRVPASPFLGDSPLARWLVAGIAVALALASALFLVAAVRALGKQWSLLPQLVEQHDLVQNGPYAVVRHPIYTSLLGLLIADGLVFTTPRRLVAAVVLYVAGTLLRIAIEEQLLRTIFGEAYAAYVQRVPALLPVWRNRGSRP